MTNASLSDPPLSPAEARRRMPSLALIEEHMGAWGDGPNHPSIKAD